MSPLTVKVMLKPFLWSCENVVSPSKWCFEYARTNPSLELVNQYCRFLTTVGEVLLGPVVLSSVISAMPLPILACDILASSCHSIVSSRVGNLPHLKIGRASCRE